MKIPLTLVATRLRGAFRPNIKVKSNKRGNPSFELDVVRHLLKGCL